MNLPDTIRDRVIAKLDLIEKAGATPVQTPPRWVTLSLLPGIKEELGGQQNKEVDAAYELFKQGLPLDGLRCIPIGADDVFVREQQ